MAKTAGTRKGTTKVVTWVTLVIAAALGTEIGLAATQTHPTPGPNPAQLVQKALTAAGREAAFHYRAVWSSNGFSQVVVGDARPSSGTQSVSVGPDRFTVVCIDRIALFNGDADALRDQLGLVAATATKVAGEWIALTPSDGPYQYLEDSVTTSTALAQVRIAPLRSSPTRLVGGVEVSRITGQFPAAMTGQAVSGSAHLDLAARSDLPTAYAAGGSNAEQPWSSTVTFSRWGDHSAISPPTTKLSYSLLVNPSGAALSTPPA